LTFEEKLLNRNGFNNDIAYDVFNSYVGNNKDLYIVYPLELKDNMLIRDNIYENVLKVVRDYITEWELYRKYRYSHHYELQKEMMRNEAINHLDKLDKLKAIMNEGISPYEWFCAKSYVDNCYILYLEEDELKFLGYDRWR
jgi:hypothetical protein